MPKYTKQHWTQIKPMRHPILIIFRFVSIFPPFCFLVVVVHQELFPCEVCGRTFAAQPLQKHRKVCEKSQIKKRKIFDSLKQRVEGTDLAPFHQKSYLKKHTHDQPTSTTIQTDNSAKVKRSKWKEKHLEFVEAIRAAKGSVLVIGSFVNNRIVKVLFHNVYILKVHLIYLYF